MQLNRFQQIFLDQVDSPKLQMKNDSKNHSKTIVIQMLPNHEIANNLRDFYQTQNL
jgi:hypothetical protein